MHARTHSEHPPQPALFDPPPPPPTHQNAFSSLIDAYEAAARVPRPPPALARELHSVQGGGWCGWRGVYVCKHKAHQCSIQQAAWGAVGEEQGCCHCHCVCGENHLRSFTDWLPQIVWEWVGGWGRRERGACKATHNCGAQSTSHSSHHPLSTRIEPTPPPPPLSPTNRHTSPPGPPLIPPFSNLPFPVHPVCRSGHPSPHPQPHPGSHHLPAHPRKPPCPPALLRPSGPHTPALPP